MALEDLPIDEYRVRKNTFKPQHRTDQCLPSAIYNIIKDLSSRNNHRLRLSLSSIGRMCSYDDGMGCPSSLDFTTIFRDELEPYNLIFKQDEGRRTNLDQIRAITIDDNTSLPIVAVHPDYVEEIGIDVTGVNDDYKMDHVLIIFGVDSDTIFLYDPYEGFLKSKHGFEDVGETINIPKFSTYWRRARSTQWLAWIEPIHRRPIDTEWE